MKWETATNQTATVRVDDVSLRLRVSLRLAARGAVTALHQPASPDQNIGRHPHGIRTFDKIQSPPFRFRIDFSNSAQLWVFVQNQKKKEKRGEEEEEKEEKKRRRKENFLFAFFLFCFLETRQTFRFLCHGAEIFSFFIDYQIRLIWLISPLFQPLLPSWLVSIRIDFQNWLGLGGGKGRGEIITSQKKKEIERIKESTNQRINESKNQRKGRKRQPSLWLFQFDGIAIRNRIRFRWLEFSDEMSRGSLAPSTGDWLLIRSVTAFRDGGEYWCSCFVAVLFCVPAPKWVERNPNKSENEEPPPLGKKKKKKYKIKKMEPTDICFLGLDATRFTFQIVFDSVSRFRPGRPVHFDCAHHRRPSGD